MCVIAVSPMGVKIPTDEQLKKMWNKNSDGAGILIDLGGGKVTYKKGLMTFEQFEAARKVLQKSYDMEKLTTAFHFRIKTHGKTDAQTTHPFMLSPRFEDLRQLEYVGNLPVMMHNGTITGYGGWINKQSSDTQDFAATIGYGLLRKTKNKRRPSKSMIKAAEKVINGSRVVTFYGDGDPLFIGNWTKINDVQYSNTSWNYSTVSQYSNTRTTYTNRIPSSVQKPDEHGMWKDASPGAGRDWIQYSSQQQLDSFTRALTQKEISGTTVYESRYLNDEHGNPKQWLLCKGTLEIVTTTGIKMKEQKKEALDAMEDMMNEITDEDYITAIDKDEFMELIEDYTYDESMDTWKDISGKPMYIDWSTYEAYSQNALMALFGDMWRYARRELISNGSLEIEWEKATAQEIQEFQKQIGKKQRKASTNIYLGDASY